MIRMAERGDAEAAEALWVYARRSRDPASAVTAACVLGDPARLVQACAWAWSGGDAAGARRAACGLGFELEGLAAEALFARLSAVNAYCQLPLSLEHVVQTVADAIASDRGVAYHHGGEGQTRQLTALCLAVRDAAQARVVVGLTPAPAWRCTPGRAWPELRPWRHDRVTADSEALRRWARAQGAGLVCFRLVSASAPGVEPPPRPPLERLAAMLERPELVAWEAFEALFAEWPAGPEREEGLRQLRQVAFVHPQLERRASVAWYEVVQRGGDAGAAPLLEVLSLGGRRLGNEAASAIVQAPWLEHFERLDLTNNLLGDAFAEALAGSRYVSHLRGLTLDINLLGRDGLLAILGAREALAGLRQLSLALARDPLGMPVSLESYALPSVKLLFLTDLALGDRGVRGLVRAPALASVRSLGLGENGLTPDAIEALARSPHVAQVEWLDLSGNPVLGDEAVSSLARSPVLGRLERLVVRGCGVGGRGLEALARSPLGARMHDLVLNENLRVGDEPGGLAALVSERRPQLARLELMGCALGLEAIQVLTAQPEHLPALRTLDLSENRLGEEAAAALADWPVLRRLSRLVLTRSRVAEAFVERLSRSPYLRPGVVRGLPELDDAMAPVRVRY